jgi:hypothetical protein
MARKQTEVVAGGRESRRAGGRMREKGEEKKERY